jgi:hypothetical protein
MAAVRAPMNRRTTWGVCCAAAVSLSAWGCGAGEATPTPSQERAVLLGTGEARFESMEGEPQLTLVAGVQGGFHVWASFLAYGFTSRTLEMVLTTSVEGTPEVIPNRANLTMKDTVDAEGTPAFTFAGFPAQVYDARCSHGKRVRIDVKLSDTDGGIAEDTRYCTVYLDESRRSPNCL